MNRTLLYRIATIVLVAIGVGLVWLSWQVRLGDEEPPPTLLSPPPGDSTIARAFQDQGRADAHGGGHAEEGHGSAAPPAAGPAAAPAGGNVYAQAGAWRDQDGETLALNSFSGRPAVFAFIYTTCDDACPLIVQSMRAGLANVPPELRERAQWLLISFDPGRDAPPALKAYREKLALKEPNWRLLTAPEDTVKALADMAGFRYSRVGEHYSHNAVIAVADANGDLVGWFADERITDPTLLGQGLTQALSL